TGVTAVA
nr:Chain A, Alpha-synuclein [Homo sapiens]